MEEECASSGRKTLEGAGITADDLSFENLYDGFPQFHQFHMEGIRYRGIQPGEALDFYQTDISISGPNPVSPSGGNIGSGRSRFWMHTDCIQQIQRRAGARQVIGRRAGDRRLRRTDADGRQLHRLERRAGLLMRASNFHGTTVSGERQRPQAVVAWTASGARALAFESTANGQKFPEWRVAGENR